MSRYMVRPVFTDPVDYWACDPNWQYVSLLLHCDGTNGGTTFTDVSPFQHEETATTKPTTDNAYLKFGTSSLKNDTTPGGCLRFPERNKEFQITQDQAFTAECWFRTSNSSASQTIMGKRSGWGDYASWLLMLDANKVRLLSSANGTSYGIDLSSTWTYTAGVWYHIALTVTASVGGLRTWRVFVDGVERISTTTAHNAISNSWPLCIGGETDQASRALQGNIDEVRILKRVALYTSTFTPPSAPFMDTTANPLVSYINSLAPTFWLRYDEPINEGTYLYGANTVLNNSGSDVENALVYGGGAKVVAGVVSDCGRAVDNIGSTAHFPMGVYTVTSSTAYWNVTAITVNATIKTSSTFASSAFNTIWHHGSAGVSSNQGLYFGYDRATGKLQCAYFNGSWRTVDIATLTGGDLLVADTEYNLTFVYIKDGGTGLGQVKGYVNGVLKGTTNLTVSVPSNTQQAAWGRIKLTNTGQNGSELYGPLDNALYFTRELSGSEIAQLATLSLT